MAPRDSLLRVEAALIEAGGSFRAHGTDRYRSECVSHGGTNPETLVIYYHPDAGNIGFRCFADRCTHDDVREFLGLSKGDLFDEPLDTGRRDPFRPRPRIVRPPKPEPPLFEPSPPKWYPDRLPTLRHEIRDADGNRTWVTHKVADEYLYRDELLRVVLGVIRCECKQFRQWHPDRNAAGCRATGIHEYAEDRKEIVRTVRVVPYRLPEVLDGVRDGQVIWIVEGEKDVKALFGRGLIATCNAAGGGRGKWTAKHAAFFKDADVRVVADRDDTGREHAKEVVNTLLRTARSIDVVQARHGKDSTDHFEAGGTLADFVMVAEPKPFVLQEAA